MPMVAGRNHRSPSLPISVFPRLSRRAGKRSPTWTFLSLRRGSSSRAPPTIASLEASFVKRNRARKRHAQAVEHGCTVADLEGLIAKGKRFPVIYADPPWPMETWSPMGRKWSDATNHYATCTIDQIKALPVAALAADDCALLMWTISLRT
jgi:hypothetical protein